MLFILVMDVLNWMVTRASEAGLLQPLSTRPIQHRISLYADDVALFLRPAAADISLTLQLLNLFGDASGLKTNVQKSNVLPIQCFFFLEYAGELRIFVLRRREGPITVKPYHTLDQSEAGVEKH